MFRWPETTEATSPRTKLTHWRRHKPESLRKLEPSQMYHKLHLPEINFPSSLIICVGDFYSLVPNYPHLIQDLRPPLHQGGHAPQGQIIPPRPSLSFSFSAWESLLFPPISLGYGLQDFGQSLSVLTDVASIQEGEARWEEGGKEHYLGLIRVWDI